MPEAPITRRFSIPTSTLVTSSIDTSDLQVSADAVAGEGVLVMCDVVSETVDSAR